MTGDDALKPRSARTIEALARQSTIITSIFERAGFEPIAPPIIQPAGLFLDLIGEDLRQRTYVFSDPEGEELCLRPDLTIPACRLYVAQHGQNGAPARYSYNGVIFRHQQSAGDAVRPREFAQAGIESYGAANPAKADAEILALTVEAIRAAGLRAFKLRLGDIGLLHALLGAIEMPERWRTQLKHHFWRPDSFRRHLARLQRPGAAAARLPQELIGRLASAKSDEAEGIVQEHLEKSRFLIAGTRTVAEVAGHLKDLAADAKAKPLPRAVADLLDGYLSIRCAARAATGEIRARLKPHGLSIDGALTAFDGRLDLIAAEGVDLTSAEFGAGFGRGFEYYSGFVFEAQSPSIGDERGVGGGGRYDGLVKAAGAARDVPAVGAAIHTERLLLAVRGGQP
jgi:ATP phosphoribosyltransferase regulatory subunit